MNRDLIAEKAGDFIRNSPESKDFESHSLLQGILIDFALELANNTEIIGSVSNRRELLLSAICQFTNRNTQKEILEVDEWLKSDYRK